MKCLYHFETETDFGKSIMNSCYYLFLFTCNQFFLSKSNPLIGPDLRQANINEFPFVDSISFQNYDKIFNNEENHYCGGALISKKHVLTSAHCLLNIEDLSEVEVYVGFHDLRMARPYKVESWKPYNKWHGRKIHDVNYTENDISIIELKEQVSADIELGVITNKKNEDLFGENATTVGWGMTSNGRYSRYLMATELNILSKDECMSNMKQVGIFNESEISPSIFLCSDSPSHVLIGRADSGGPLIINKNETIGINDSISPTGEDNPKEINIHIGVDIYRDYIAYQIKEKSIWPWKKSCGTSK